MGYSITFGTGNTTRNTWTNWKLLPESPPVVPPPKPKTNYVDIPGRARGPLDMSQIPFNRLNYERIIGSWNFIISDDYWHKANRKTAYENIRGWLHGKTTRMVLEEDVTHFFYGRFTVDAPNSGAGPFVIRITYDLEPLRYNVSNNTADTTWLPDVEAISWSSSGLIDDITPIQDSEIHNLFN